ncbi:MAG: riboflavin biosynthesis protein RibF [Candidatus Aureabacteria bacterium]|nr:riboflavin biosynthesis protein RibF [Candidatus Auribacterota bacterium]
MKIYHAISPRSPRPPLIVGIGAFDGVHRGHRAVLAAVRRLAGAKGRAGVITFGAHPRRVVGAGGGESLTTLAQRRELFRAAGIDVCWLLEFDRRFSLLSPEAFVRGALERKLRVAGVCVGEGFRFGRGREGTVASLRRMGADFGFRVREVPAVRVDGRRVSSTRIRSLLARGDVRAAAKNLGRDYVLTGTVGAGARRGRSLGYPTANFIPEQMSPRPGVYAVSISVGRLRRPGMLYLGRRPTPAGNWSGELGAEANLFGFTGNLYGRRIKVFLKNRLRSDIKFKTMAALLRQIRRDEIRARFSGGSLSRRKGECV